jgi:hypothetical protein
MGDRIAGILVVPVVVVGLAAIVASVTMDLSHAFFPTFSAVLFWGAIFGWLGFSIGDRRCAGPAGGLLGAIFGPLGLILAALCLDNRPTCHMCHGRLDGAPELCPHCRTDLASSRRAFDSIRQAAVAAEPSRRKAVAVAHPEASHRVLRVLGRSTTILLLFVRYLAIVVVAAALIASVCMCLRIMY